MPTLRGLGADGLQLKVQAVKNVRLCLLIRHIHMNGVK